MYVQIWFFRETNLCTYIFFLHTALSYRRDTAVFMVCTIYFEGTIAELSSSLTPLSDALFQDWAREELVSHLFFRYTLASFCLILSTFVHLTFRYVEYYFLVNLNSH